MIVTKAAKNNAIVVMERSLYDSKVYEVLQQCGVKENSEFNFSNHVQEVRDAINDSTVIIKSARLKKVLLTPNPTPPLLYGLPKVHKENMPMRPVVSFVSSPTYSLAKYLDRWFKSRTEFESPYSVKNSSSLAHSLKNESLPAGSTLCSFDVVGLFPNIPKAVTMQRMGELLVNSNTPHEELSEFFDLLKICWSPNFCKFNSKFFEFPDEVGIPIGSPLGSLISEVFMSKFESDLFSSGHHLLNNIVYWRRYVDDVLCTWTGHRDLCLEFLAYLNKHYPSIKFTLEVGGTSINFLNLTVSERDGVYEFEVYRKDTSTDGLVHGSSFCSVAHKYAAFNSFVHRLRDILLSQTAFRMENI